MLFFGVRNPSVFRLFSRISELDQDRELSKDDLLIVLINNNPRVFCSD